MADVKDVKKVNKREFLKKYHKANKALEMCASSKATVWRWWGC